MYGAGARYTHLPHRGPAKKFSAAIMNRTVVGCKGNEVEGEYEITCPQSPELGM